MDLAIIAMALAGKEAEWLNHLLTVIPMWGKPILVIPLNSDSKSAIDKVYNRTKKDKSRNICLRHNPLRQLLKPIH